MALTFKNAIVATFALIAPVLATMSNACVHFDLAFHGKVDERHKEAFIFHDGELAHLVIRTRLETTGALPESAAWVLPLPAMPRTMEVVDGSFFRELRALTEPARIVTGIARCDGSDCPRAPAPVLGMPSMIREGATTVTGDYTLTPIEVLAEQAGTELNVWLERNGFSAMTVQEQNPYLKKGAVFLAVKFKLPKEGGSELKPLHLAYPSNNAQMPLKLSSRSGVFNLTLYTFTADEPPADTFRASHLERHYVRSIRGIDLEDTAPELQKLIGNRIGVLTRFSGIDFNTPGKMVAALSTDPLVPAMGGMDTATVTRVAQRQVLMAILFTASAGLFLWSLRRTNADTPAHRWRRSSGLAGAFAVFAGAALWLSDEYAMQVKRAVVSEAILAGSSYRTAVSEAAQANGTLRNSGMELASLNKAESAISISRDGVITAYMDPQFTGVAMKVVMTPTLLKDDIVTWHCEAYPESTARRFAPEKCKPR